MTDETTPDAVEQAIARLVHVLVNECSHMSETASALDVCIGNLRHARRAERAPHAEEVEALRDQLRKVEGERDAERKHATEMEERALDLVRDLRLAQVELHALRSLLPDVRACAEYIVERGVDNADGSARRILAALASQGGEGE